MAPTQQRRRGTRAQKRRRAGWNDFPSVHKPPLHTRRATGADGTATRKIGSPCAPGASRPARVRGPGLPPRGTQGGCTGLWVIRGEKGAGDATCIHRHPRESRHGAQNWKALRGETQTRNRKLMAVTNSVAGRGARSGLPRPPRRQAKTQSRSTQAEVRRPEALLIRCTGTRFPNRPASQGGLGPGRFLFKEPAPARAAV